MGPQGAMVMVTYSLSLLGALGFGTLLAAVALLPLRKTGSPRLSTAVLLGSATALYALALFSWQSLVGGWLGLTVLVIILATCVSACVLSVAGIITSDGRSRRALVRWSRPAAFLLAVLSATMLVLFVLPFIYVVPLKMR